MWCARVVITCVAVLAASPLTAGDISDAIALLEASLACPVPAYRVVTAKETRTQLDRSKLELTSYHAIGSDYPFRLEIRRQVISQSEGRKPYEFSDTIAVNADWKEIGETAVDGDNVLVKCRGTRKCFRFWIKSMSDGNGSGYFGDIVLRIKACDGATAENLKAAFDVLSQISNE